MNTIRMLNGHIGALMEEYLKEGYRPSLLTSKMGSYDLVRGTSLIRLDTYDGSEELELDNVEDPVSVERLILTVRKTLPGVDPYSRQFLPKSWFEEIARYTWYALVTEGGGRVYGTKEEIKTALEKRADRIRAARKDDQTAVVVPVGKHMTPVVRKLAAKAFGFKRVPIKDVLVVKDRKGGNYRLMYLGAVRNFDRYRTSWGHR